MESCKCIDVQWSNDGLLVHNLIKPIASLKNLFLTLSLSFDLPEYAIGDEKHLMQVLLNVVLCCKILERPEYFSFCFVAKSESLEDPQAPRRVWQLWECLYCEPWLRRNNCHLHRWCLRVVTQKRKAVIVDVNLTGKEGYEVSRCLDTQKVCRTPGKASYHGPHGNHRRIPISS